MAANETVNKPGNDPGPTSADKRTTRSRTGAQILVDQLIIHGVDTAYCVPGESYLAVLDALYDTREQVRLVVCRQEGGAAYMADAYGKLPAGRDLLRDPRTRRDQRQRRRAHRLSGLDADDPLHRPGRAPLPGARGVPGTRLRPDVRPDGQVGGANRRPPPHPRTDGARVYAGDFRTARPSGNRAARRYAARARHGRRRGSLQNGAGQSGCGRDGAAPGDAGGFTQAADAAWRHHLDGASGRRHRRVCRGQPARDRQHVSPPGPHRQSPSMLRGRPRASERVPRSRNAFARRISSSRSARA